MTKQKDVKITVELNKDDVPTNIVWSADDMQGATHAHCRAMLLSLWDNDTKDTLKLDLWTDKMTIDEMKIFFHQTLVTMADTFKRSTDEQAMYGDMMDFCDYFAEKMNIVE